MRTGYKHFRVQLIILGKWNLGVVKIASDCRLQAFNPPMDSKSPLPAQIECLSLCVFNVTIDQNV